MNIVYLLTNQTNGRKYIGQKVECRIEIIDGLSTIINNKTELPYLGSSSNIEMKEDLKIHKFQADVLEIVVDKKKIVEREDFWIRFYNAVELQEFYNLNYPLDFFKRDFQHSIKNEFGETYARFASNEFSVSKRINSAKNVGFTTLEEFYLDVYQKMKSEKNLSLVAKSYKIERHTISRLVQEVNLEKFYTEVSNFSNRTKNKVIDFRTKGASIKKIAELLGLEFPTVLFYIGTEKFKNKNFLVSKRKGLTEDEMGYRIMDAFLKSKSLKTIAKEMNLSNSQVQRTFQRFIRKHIEINDFNGILNE